MTFRYSYIARDMDGVLIDGVMEAEDERDARNRLRQKGFYATSINAVRKWQLWNRSRKIKSEEIAIFAEQLATMIDAGLPLVRCLTTLAQQNKSDKLKQIINEIRRDVESGASLADSLAKYPEVFSNLFINLVRAGEVGGALDRLLRRLANYLDREQETRQTLKSALVFPKIVVTLCILVFIFMNIFIVPRFAMLYDSFGVELPLPTILLMKTSEFILNFWWAILLGIAGLIIGYRKFSTSNVGREILDRVKLRLPVFGDIISKVAVSRFARVLGVLNIGGVPILQSLEVAEQIVDNIVVSRIIKRASANVRKGGGLEEPLSTSKVFPSMTVQMISMGEEVGKLGEALEKSANYLDREIDAAVKRLIAKLEPAMTIILAATVGLFALAIYLPMFDIVKGVSN